MNILKNFLTRYTAPPNEPPRIAVEPGTRFGWVIGKDGEPLRVDSNYTRVVVPVYDFSAAGIDEDEPMAKVLVEASRQAPLKLALPKQVDPMFWIKNNRHMKLFIFHPDLLGQLFLPVGVPTFKSAQLPRNQVTCLGPAASAGYYVQHGHERGILAHDKKGLLGIQFSMLEP